MTLLFLYLALAIGVSFICSILEAVLLSVNPSYVAKLQVEGRRAGRMLAVLREDIDRPLAAILTLNTVAHTVGAAGVGAQAERIWGSASLGIVSGVTTLLILFLSEIIPKTLGATHWRRLAPASSFVIRSLVTLTWPCVWISKGITRWLAPGDRKDLLTREEFSAMAVTGFDQGVFSEDESRVVQNAMRFQKIHVREVMTPRTVVAGLPEELKVGEFVQDETKHTFSRLPVYRGNVDSLSGFVLKDVLLQAATEGEEDQPVGDYVRPIIIVPELCTIARALRLMIGRREHIAAVVDEYGGFSGLVTMEDIFETLIGEEILDEGDMVADMRDFARKTAVEATKMRDKAEGGGGAVK